MVPLGPAVGRGLKQSEAWVLQAKSDLSAAQAVFKESDASTYCQALAKYQQVTEKSVKGMVASLKELGVTQLSISGNHALEHEMNGLDAVRRKRADLDDASIGVIDRMLRSHKTGIIWLSVLAPSGPKGLVYPKNTEYPFNNASADGWTAPAASDVYTTEEVRRAHRPAWPLHQIAARFTSSLRRRR